MAHHITVIISVLLDVLEGYRTELGSYRLRVFVVSTT